MASRLSSYAFRRRAAIKADWRASRTYSYVKPYVPDWLRRLAGRCRLLTETRIRSHRILDFGPFRLEVSNRETGGILHEKTHWHEVSNPIELETAVLFRPHVYLDVGANYGFASALHFSLNPTSTIIAVEANPTLIPYIHKNLRRVGCERLHVVNAVCSSETAAGVGFWVNRAYSQDSRVVGPDHGMSVTVPAVTIDSCLEGAEADSRVFVKIDTQGYERHVMSGGRSFFSSSSAWMIKLEFSPRLLRLQGTEPVSFLRELVESYSTVELPARARFKGDTLLEILRQPLVSDDCLAFVGYIERLAKSHEGQCDLLIVPRTSPLLVHVA